MGVFHVTLRGVPREEDAPCWRVAPAWWDGTELWRTDQRFRDVGWEVMTVMMPQEVLELHQKYLQALEKPSWSLSAKKQYAEEAKALEAKLIQLANGYGLVVVELIEWESGM